MQRLRPHRGDTARDPNLMDIVLISSTIISRPILNSYRAQSLSALVAQACETAHIPVEECRLAVVQSESDEVQIWPLVDCGATFTRLPGLQRLAGPGLVSTAASLIAAGMPVRLLELVLKEVCEAGIHAAPLEDFFKGPNVEGPDPEAAPHDRARLHAFVEVEDMGTPTVRVGYNTPDGLPFGPRVRVTGATSGGEASMQVPSCIQLSHLVTLLNKEPGLLTGDPMTTRCMIEGVPQQLGFKPICELPEFRDDCEVALHLELAIEQIYKHSRMVMGRPLTSDSGWCIAAAATSALEDAWSSRTVQQLLRIERS
eukprot:TRINITY_DN3864_c0_g1_i2.p1 TRINITY_DN3864_c0_g1~~TRINITY_DN3864_c0_g1_i2.p1  ORF type:complete len:313 (+),score=36.02 TRINITY_DN3864_c0_g1_i2:134-1072(+)